MKFIQLFTIISLFNIFAGSFVYIFMPEYRYQLKVEDRFVENLTAIFYFMTFLSGVYFMRLNNKKKIKDKILVLFIFTSIFCFLDELSYGERIFNLKMPTISNEKFDALHDLFYIIYKITVDNIVIMDKSNLIYLVFLFIFLMFVIFFVSFKYINDLFKKLYRDLPSTFLSVFVVFMLLAAMIDLGIIWYGPLFMMEEIFELNGSLALLFGCFVSYGKSNGLVLKKAFAA